MFTLRGGVNPTGEFRYSCVDSRLSGESASESKTRYSLQDILRNIVLKANQRTATISLTCVRSSIFVPVASNVVFLSTVFLLIYGFTTGTRTTLPSTTFNITLQSKCFAINVFNVDRQTQGTLVKIGHEQA